jgi:pre-mRNA-splicing factor SYF1
MYPWLIYKQALKNHPGSYKLWRAYIAEKKKVIDGLRPDHPALGEINHTYEIALVSMHKMPRIWLDYLEFLVEQKAVTLTRRTFNRSLQALPITQHSRIWSLCISFFSQPDIPKETSIRLFQRYLQIEPSYTEEYITFLKNAGLWIETAKKMLEVVNNDEFRSLEGKNKFQFWLELCDIITKHSENIKDLQVEEIMRDGIIKFADEVGRLWISLADYHIRRGLFERARDIYEEGINTVITVRDFSLIFDAYAHFEESVLLAKIEAQNVKFKDEAFNNADDSNERISVLNAECDLDLLLAKLDFLMVRRPLLVSSVILRQNPHNVSEWHKRVIIGEEIPMKQIATYSDAVNTIDISKATGKPHSLWCSFAKFYERHQDYEMSTIIYERAVSEPFLWLDDLAYVYCEWVETELKHNNYKNARHILHTALRTPEHKHDVIRTREEATTLSCQERLFKSSVLWNLRLDLEESLGTLESTMAVYYRMIDLRLCTPQTILNFAHLVVEHNFFEQAFQIYERGLTLFRFPHSKEIWQSYLDTFIRVYQGTKLERTRDLFEQVLNVAPIEERMTFFLQYAETEQRFGHTRRAMQIYERAVRGVSLEQRLPIYEIFLRRAEEFFGFGKVREVYEMAIEAPNPYHLTDEDVKNLSLRYAKLECKLGEINRARAIFVHASQFANPVEDNIFWEDWKHFEVQNGSEDSFRDMLRIKRSVGVSLSTMHLAGRAGSPGVILKTVGEVNV